MDVGEKRSASMFGFHEAPTQPGRRQRSSDGDAALVLIVDDDPDMRAIYTTCLEQFGYRTAAESSGEDAVRTATRIRPSAILMDGAMPGIGGIEATRLLKADPRTRRCPVVMITAHDTALFEEARKVGCDAYFCKPFNVFALDSILRVLSGLRDSLPVASDSVAIKQCSCGATYSMDAWLALPLCGRMHVNDSKSTIVELRNCKCGSTLVIPLEEGR